MTPLSADQRSQERADAEATFATLPRGNLLLPYQQRTIDLLFSGVSLLAIDKSRRIGLTWGLAAFAALKASASMSAGGQNVWYMGYDKDMTLEFIEVAAMWCRAFNLIAGDIEEEEVLDEESGQPVKAFSIRCASGFRITALPSVPRALRGKQGIVIIDEAAFHKNVAEVIKSAVALLIWGGQLVVVSTHDGFANPFNKLLEEIDAGTRRGKRLTIPFAQAMADGLYERVALVAKTKGAPIAPKAEWEADIRATYGDDAGEELDCVPKVGSGSLISIEDIVACEHDECGDGEFYLGNAGYLAADVARRVDGQVQYFMEAVGDVLWQRDTYEEVGQTFAHQDAFFDKVMMTRRVALASVDQGGMGEKVVEDRQRRWGQRVQGLLLVGPTRLDIAMSLARRFQERRIRIRPDLKTRADLMAIKKLGSEASGNVRIVNDSSVHADRFWAYGMASRAADMPAAMYAYQSVPKGAPRQRDALWGHPDDRPSLGRRAQFGGY